MKLPPYSEDMPLEKFAELFVLLKQLSEEELEKWRVENNVKKADDCVILCQPSK